MAGSSGALTASFTLKLEDLLSPGLVALMKTIKGLGDLMKTLGFSELKGATDKLRDTANAANVLGKNLDDVGRLARATTQNIDGLGNDGAAGLRRIAQEANVASHAIATIKRSFSGFTMPGGAGAGIPLLPEVLRNADPSGGRQNDWRRGGRALASLHNNFGAVEGAVAGLSIVEPVRRYADIDREIRQIPIIAGMTGAEALAETSRLTRLFNRESRETGLSMKSIIETYAFLRRAPGMSADMVDTALAAHGRVAVAYNVDPASLGQGVYAAIHKYGLGKSDLEKGLATIAIGSNFGHFTIDDASRALPGIGAAFSSQGVTGLAGLSRSMAMLQALRLGTPDSGTAVTQLQEMMHYAFQGIATDSFLGRGRHLSVDVRRLVARNLPPGTTGIDLPKMLLEGQRLGIDPMNNLLGKLAGITKGLNPTEMNLVLGQLIHNDTARKGFLNFLQAQDEYRKWVGDLMHVDTARLARDHASAIAGAGRAPDVLDANVSQLVTRLGPGFLGAVTGLNQKLDALNAWIEKTDDAYPGLINNVLKSVAAFLAMIAALGTLGFVAGPVAAGFRLLMAPLTLLSSGLMALGLPITATVGLVALLGAAAAELYFRWQSFAPGWTELWGGVKESFRGFLDFLTGAYTGDWESAGQNLMRIWKSWGAEIRGGVSMLKGLLGEAKAAFDKLDEWTGGGIIAALNTLRDIARGVADAIKGIADVKMPGTIGPDGKPATGAPAGYPPGLLTDFDGGPFGALLAPRPVQPAEVRLMVGLDQGLVAKTVPQQTSDGVTVRLLPDRGPTLGRP